MTVWARATKLWRAQTPLLASALAAAGLLLVFGFVAQEVVEGEPLALDRRLMLALRNPADPTQPLGPPWVQEMARDITALGSHGVLGIIVFTVVVYLLLDRKRAAASVVLASVLGGMALNTLLKHGFARPRPDLFTPAARVFTASFPSGHATLSAITYLTLAALLTSTQASWRMRVYFVTIGALLTVLVGISRVYLGVHYPTDVLAGWCIGSAWALGSWVVMTRLQQEGRVEPPERS
jgi:undecaprenyl-diphosphatase